MSTLRNELQAIIDELRPNGPHANEAAALKILHVLRSVGLISIDTIGKLDDVNRDVEIKQLAAEVESLLQDVAALIGKPGLSLVFRLFGRSSVESALLAVAPYTDNIDDWIRDNVMPIVHETREFFVEFDDELINSFTPPTASA